MGRLRQRITSSLGSLGFSLMLASCSATQPQQEHTITNGAVMSGLAEEIARSLTQEAGIVSSDTCEVTFVPAEGLMFLEHAFLESMRQSATIVETERSLAGRSVSVEIQPLLARVLYADPFRNGLFGESMIGRSISVEVSAKVQRHPEGQVVLSGARRKEYRDTVRVDQVKSLESSVLAVTKADVPAETVLDRILGPMIILSASGVLLYLLYTVRS